MFYTPTYVISTGRYDFKTNKQGRNSTTTLLHHLYTLCHLWKGFFSYISLFPPVASWLDTLVRTKITSIVSLTSALGCYFTTFESTQALSLYCNCTVTVLCLNHLSRKGSRYHMYVQLLIQYCSISCNNLLIQQLYLQSHGFLSPRGSSGWLTARCLLWGAHTSHCMCADEKFLNYLMQVYRISWNRHHPWIVAVAANAAHAHICK